jgi:putative flippase GtrA
VRFVRWLLRHSFVRFAVVGTVGYMVDAAVLALDTQWLGMDPYSGRVLSIFAAMTVTWLGNRYLTFARRRARGAAGAAREWLKFTGANAVGAAVNYGVYAALVHSGPPPWDDKYAAQFLGVLAGLVFNFTLSRFFVFRAPPA